MSDPSASAVVIHNEEALYQVHAPLPLQNVQGHRVNRANRVTPDHARTLILTLNLTVTLNLNPNPIPKPYPYP